ncbi:hypothetical protein [Vreelandella aquamarina]|uniref:hypothetical protein n=1 Tax=Vreelandella aquamarina TaxID=77097 RepID=UPI0007852EB1|nr:hypothetical protein [Halomonas axialensis]
MQFLEDTMQCDCQTKVAEKLAEHVKAKLPEGFKDFDAKLQGYGFTLTGNQMSSPLMIGYQGEVWVPKKDPTKGMKRQKIDTFVTANLCPFCGKAAKPDDDKEAA